MKKTNREIVVDGAPYKYTVGSKFIRIRSMTDNRNLTFRKVKIGRMRWVGCEYGCTEPCCFGGESRHEVTPKHIAEFIQQNFK
jgi:hypothetical protein